MHPLAIATWNRMVTYAVAEGYTMAQFSYKLQKLGEELQALLPPNFEAEELVPPTLELLEFAADNSNLAANEETAPIGEYHYEIPTQIPFSSSDNLPTLKREPSTISLGSESPEPLELEVVEADIFPMPPSLLTQTLQSPRKVKPTTTAIIAKSTKVDTFCAKPVIKRKAVQLETFETVVAKKRNRQSQPQKPKCWSSPLVWSNRRQELCETAPYYKLYQSSWYHPGGIAKAMFMAKDDSPRRHVDTDVIITRATGGMSEDPDKQGSRMTSGSHKDEDATVRAIKDAFAAQRAVIIIASNKLDVLPVDLPHNFQVLGHFWITDYWWEKVGKHHVFKYRFERCDLHEKPWYAPVDTEFAKPDFSILPSSRHCEWCKQFSVQVYQVWVCLTHECPLFWKLSDGREPDEKTLEFNVNFIQKRSQFTGTKEYDIRPPDFKIENQQMVQHIFFRDGRFGLWCSKCGKCCSRENWISWNCACGSVRTLDMPVLTVPEADSVLDKNGQRVALGPKVVKSTIKPFRHNIGKYKVEAYEVLEDQWIYHFKSNPKINAQLNGPDQLFKDMQEAKSMELCRHIVGNHKPEAPSTALTSHFAKNYGLHYDFVVAQDSSPFSTAPPAVCHALQRLIWAGGATKMEKCKPFNEMLVVGYNAGGMMHYHDDGENTLGPTIATLSLGSSAVMDFRYKKKYWKVPLAGKNSDKYTAESIVFPGVPLEKERKAMQKWIASHPSSTPEAQAKHFVKMEAVKTYLARKREPSHYDIVQLMLNHGDICIMHGADLQKYIEHQVEPRGCLRFALTSRHVLPNLLDPAVLHMGDVDLSTFPPYDGQEN